MYTRDSNPNLCVCVCVLSVYNYDFGVDRNYIIIATNIKEQ